MKKDQNLNALVICIFTLFLYATVNAAGYAGGEPPEEEWNRTFGGSGGEVMHFFQKTSDEGYIILGTTESYDGGGIWVVKTNPEGQMLWSRRLGDKNNEKPEAVIQTSDGGYLIAGSSGSNILILKIDSDGNIQWKKDFGNASKEKQAFGVNYYMTFNEVEWSIKQMTDDSYIILWSTSECEKCPMNIFLTRIDQNGKEMWNITPCTGSCKFFPVPDGGFVLAGTSSLDKSMIWFKKSDINGNEQWNRTLKDGTNDIVFAVQGTSDDGYIIAGIEKKDPLENSGGRIWLFRTDPEGNQQWNNTFMGEYDSINIIRQTEDGGFLLGNGGWSSWLMKIDIKGNEEWRKTITGISINSAELTKDNGYLLAGIKRLSWDSFGGNIVVKLDHSGNQQWMKNIESDSRIFFQLKRTALETPDGGYIFAGTSNGIAPDFRLIKLKRGNKPNALFTYSPEYPGVNQVIVFDVLPSYDPDGFLGGYKWDFADGNTTTVLDNKTVHSYGQEGEFTVTLTVTDNNGIVNSTSKKISVQKYPSPEDTWNMTFGDYDGGKYAAETMDGGFIIAGESFEGSLYSWILKIDASGKEQWNRRFGGIGIRSVAMTSGGEIIAIGDTLPDGDIWITKIYPNGYEQWNKSFTGEGFDQAGSVIPTADGGVLIAGIYASSNNEHADAWIIKIDPNGTTQWNRRFSGGSGRNMANGIRQTKDGGYIAVGTMSGIDSTEVWLIKADSGGNEMWTRNFSKGGLNWGHSVKAEDSGFLVFATSINITYPHTTSDIWLMKTDPEGNEVWRKILFNVNGLASPLFITNEDSYLFSEMVQERPDNYENDEIIYTLFVKTDHDGNVLWRKKEEGISSIPTTSDGGHIILRENRLIKLGGEKPVQTQPLQKQSEQPTNVTPPISSTPGFDWILGAGSILIAVYFVFVLRRNKI